MISEDPGPAPWLRPRRPWLSQMAVLDVAGVLVLTVFGVLGAQIVTAATHTLTPAASLTYGIYSICALAAAIVLLVLTACRTH